MYISREIVDVRYKKKLNATSKRLLPHFDGVTHGLRTPNEGINQRYQKNWADVADKICCRHTSKFGIEF